MAFLYQLTVLEKDCVLRISDQLLLIHMRKLVRIVEFMWGLILGLMQELVMQHLL